MGRLGSSLKPAVEFFTLCRKPLSEKTIAANVLKWGTGGINIDGCRVEHNEDATKVISANKESSFSANAKEWTTTNLKPQGRFPANLIHSGEQEVLELFPETKSAGKARTKDVTSNYEATSYGAPETRQMNRFGDSGSAARFFKSIEADSEWNQQVEQHDAFIAENPNVKVFVDNHQPRAFYCAKASKKDRDEGLEQMEDRVLAMSNQAKAELARGNMHDGASGVNTAKVRKNNHPTVKPTALMAYLCRLITPTGGVVLDPYMGSGSTGKAAIREGFSFVGVELDEDYYNIAKARINHEA